jgi:hypothetical protein
METRAFYRMVRERDSVYGRAFRPSEGQGGSGKW